MKKLRKVYKYLQYTQQSILTIMISLCITTSLYPFINIIMSAMILNAFTTDADFYYIVKLAMIMITLNLIVVSLRDYISNKWQFTASLLWKHEDIVITKKMLSMDYKVIDTPYLNTTKQKLTDGRMMGNNLSTLLYQLKDLFIGIIGLIASLIIVTRLFISTQVIQGNNIFLYLVILLVMAGIFSIIKIGNIRNNFMHSMQYDPENVRGNTYFMYLFFQLLKKHTNGKDIRIYDMRELIFDDERNASRSSFLKRFLTKMGKLFGLAEMTNGIFMVLIGAVIYMYSAQNAINGVIQLGEVLLYAGAIEQLVTNICSIISNYSYVKMTYESLDPMLEFMDLESDMYKGTLPIEKRDDNQYEIEFKNVSFKYDNNDEYAIKDLSFSFAIGEKIAVVGMNGAGKTTFVKLLCRLYDPQEGMILLNGIDIKKYDYDEYLSIFSAVFQDFSTLAFTLGENIACKKEYDKDRLNSILKDANLLDRVQKMEKGVDAYIYNYFEDGVEISGGEAQKIAIARALYKDTPFIILDEPTASLDPISEYEVYSNFNNLVKDRTTVYISHRLSSCRFCDKILVFHEGELIEEGVHDTLLDKVNSKYAELWNAQAQYYREEGLDVVQ